MTYIKKVDLTCPSCGADDVHLSIEQRASGDPGQGVAGSQVKFYVNLADVPVLSCRGKITYRVSEGEPGHGYATWLESRPCLWTLDGFMDSDGKATFDFPQ